MFLLYFLTEAYPDEGGVWTETATAAHHFQANGSKSTHVTRVAIKYANITCIQNKGDTNTNEENKTINVYM